MNRQKIAQELVSVARELTAAGGPPALRDLSNSIRQLHKVKSNIEWMMELALGGSNKAAIKMSRKMERDLKEAIADIEDFSRKTIPYYASRMGARDLTASGNLARAVKDIENWKGEAYQKGDDIDQALDAIKKVIDNSGNLTRAVKDIESWKGEAYQRGDDIDQAVDVIKGIIKSF